MAPCMPYIAVNWSTSTDTQGLPMLAAMESDSTDGESSLLSFGSGDPTSPSFSVGTMGLTPPATSISMISGTKHDHSKPHTSMTWRKTSIGINSKKGMTSACGKETNSVTNSKVAGDVNSKIIAGCISASAAPCDVTDRNTSRSGGAPYDVIDTNTCGRPGGAPYDVTDTNTFGGSGAAPCVVSSTAKGTSPSAVLCGSKTSGGEISQKDIDTTFYFETDHVALKGNRDYQTVLRHVVLLESKRMQSIKDLDKLRECREEALADPINFVDKLQRQVDLKIPCPIRIPETPQIDWSSYTSNIDPLNFKQPKHMTRHSSKKNIRDTISRSLDPSTSYSGESRSDVHSHHGNRTSTITCPAPQPHTSHSEYTTDSNGLGDQSNDDVMVRGRVKTGTKTETFNQLWTVDEQRRLEELLLKHPPEEVEVKRWQKIAKELGNRSTKQVQSRVQKYFIKLAKKGLPIPGRMPHMITYHKKQGHQHHRHHKFLQPSSTFLSSYEAPVRMADDDNDDYSQAGSSVDYSDTNMGPNDDISDDDDIPVHLRVTAEYQELMQLQRLRKQKQQEALNSVQHVGYKCDHCGCEPIVGTRWHCGDCPVETSVDFCDNCVDLVYEVGTHLSSHQLDPVKEAESWTSAPHLDRDYTKFLPGDYNYLDPNYMPAS